MKILNINPISIKPLNFSDLPYGNICNGETLSQNALNNMSAEEIFAHMDAQAAVAKAKIPPKDLYSLYGAEHRLFIFEDGTEPYFGENIVKFDLGFLNRKPLELKEIGTYPFPKEAREQSNTLAKGKIPLDAILVDGFRWHGEGSVFDEKGGNTAIPDRKREIIIVDRKEDAVLAAAISSFKKGLEGKNLSEKEIAIQIFYFIDRIFNRTPRSDEDFDNFADKMRHSPPKETLLGDIMNDGEGVCRHKSLLAKVLSDEVGIKMNVISNKKHVWNEVMFDGGRYIFDPMLEALFSLDKPSKDAKKYLATYSE